jgi:hypothetical protein
LAVNGDACYNFGPNPCQGDYVNLENFSRANDDLSLYPWGENVESRVASALYDLYDYPADGFDSISAGFSPISKIALHSPAVTTFIGFWNQWTLTSNQNTFASGLTLWWNTIEFVTARQIYLPVISK